MGIIDIKLYLRECVQISRTSIISKEIISELHIL